MDWSNKAYCSGHKQCNDCSCHNSTSNDLLWFLILSYMAGINTNNKGGARKTSESDGDESFEELINRVAVTNTIILQLTLIEEESTEVLKEICKLRRGKAGFENLTNETIDVVTASLVFLRQMGYSEEDIKSRIKDNLKYALYQDDSIGKR